ncbi:MAG: hypothetical protein JRN15_05165 [Nitrososphaerota archaeon]|nr:hypothetical protein [Nitrososphaerota archaeon]
MINREMTAYSFGSTVTETEKVINGVKVNEIVEIFEDLGYECKLGTELTGVSGARHQFDIVARKDTEIVVIDLVSFRASLLDAPVSDDEVSEQMSIAGLRMRVKGWDCGAYQRIIIHLSSYFSNDSSRVSQYDPFEQFLKEFDIQVIKCTNVHGAAEKLQALIGAVEAS